MTLEQKYFDAKREGRAEGRAEGRTEGRTEGENRFAGLIKLLIAQKRYDEVAIASENPVVREKLYLEFGLQ